MVVTHIRKHSFDFSKYVRHRFNVAVNISYKECIGCFFKSFNETYIYRASFTNCTFDTCHNSSFQSCLYIRCVFSGAALYRACFGDSEFHDCVFSDADLIGASFINVVFYDCAFDHFRDDNLELRDTTFLGCRFR